jgi:hypothetical protein
MNFGFVVKVYPHAKMYQLHNMRGQPVYCPVHGHGQDAIQPGKRAGIL